MTSETAYQEAYVWVWLPGAVEPVVAGRLARAGNQLIFNYGQSYLSREDAVPIYEPELPLKAGELPLIPGLNMPSCIRDAAPDAWGRRIIINKKFGKKGSNIDAGSIDELTYLLESGSDRSGALDFQITPTRYAPHEGASPSLNELLTAARRVEDGIPLTPELERALLHGSSIGGARPKAIIVEGDKKYIAKFSSRTDTSNVVKAEFIAMRLAASAGLNTAHVELVETHGKYVLLVERFDRERNKSGWLRKAMVSALTLFELDELMARYASYEDLATVIRHRFDNPKENLQELFSRLVFNILCGNTDDHARNHAAFWDGRKRSLTLTPAYDICPQARSGREATQAMLITGNEHFSQIATCLKAAPNFQLSHNQAVAIIDRQVRIILDKWEAVCAEARLTETERNFLWRRQFLNPFAFDGAPASLSNLVQAR